MAGAALPSAPSALRSRLRATYPGAQAIVGMDDADPQLLARGLARYRGPYAHGGRLRSPRQLARASAAAVWRPVTTDDRNLGSGCRQCRRNIEARFGTALAAARRLCRRPAALLVFQRDAGGALRQSAGEDLSR